MNPRASSEHGDGAMNPDVSTIPGPSSLTSTDSDRYANLPPLPVLQAWVHRPQAVAECFIKDVMALQALAYTDGHLSHSARDVFLLDRFPCRVVEIVAFVVGVVHKESTVTVTRELTSSFKLTAVDEGNGFCVLDVVVRLPQLELPKTKRKREEEVARPETFKTAAERRRERLAGVQHYPPPKPENTQVYIRPDIRIGDSVRVVGQVNEWARGGKEWIRQLTVDEASGVGSITVVDSDEEYDHIEKVVMLHKTVYSQPFTMPVASTPAPSPTKSIVSSAVSDYGGNEEEDPGPDLPDPSKLPNSRLTEDTFKLYTLDYMTRETVKNVRELIDGRTVALSEQEPMLGLYPLFPEYRRATSSSLPARPKARSPIPIATSESDSVFGATADEATDATPRATFRTKAEREAGAKVKPAASSLASTSQAPRAFRSQAERKAAAERKAMAEMTTASASEPELLTQVAALPAFTIPNLLTTPILSDLATRIVDTRARNEEKERRKRKKQGTTTAQDRRVVADRISRGLEETSYKLSQAEREKKILGLAQWAIRTAHAEGGLVQVNLSEPARDTCRRRTETAVGYLPLPPELLAHLLVPLISAMKSNSGETFRSRLERAAISTARARNRIDAASVRARLQTWGEDGRWERVGMWAVEAALKWGEMAGVLDI